MKQVKRDYKCVWAVIFVLMLVAQMFPSIFTAMADGLVELTAESLNDGESIVLTWDATGLSGTATLQRTSFALETTPLRANTYNGSSNAAEWKDVDTVELSLGTYANTLTKPESKPLIAGNSYKYRLWNGSAEISTISDWVASKPIEDFINIDGGEAINIARGKPIIDTPSNTDRQTWKMVDGYDLQEKGTAHNGHFWANASTNGFPTQESPVYVTLDLLKPETFQTIAIIPRLNEVTGDANRNGWGPRKFLIHFSNNLASIDAGTAYTVYDTTDYPCYPTTTEISASGKTENVYIDNDFKYANFYIKLPEPQTARYIRLMITNAYSASTQNNVQIRELKVFRHEEQPPTFDYGINIPSISGDGTFSAQITYPTDAPQTTTAIISVYDDDDQLVFVKPYKGIATGGSGTYEISENISSLASVWSSIKEARVMLLESLSGIRPLVKSVEIEGIPSAIE